MDQINEWESYEAESYVAAMFLLLQGESVDVVADEHLTHNYSGADCLIACVSVEGDMDDWDSFAVKLELLTASQQHVSISASPAELGQKEAYYLARYIFSVKSDGEYESFDEFLGCEIS